MAARRYVPTGGTWDPYGYVPTRDMWYPHNYGLWEPHNEPHNYEYMKEWLEEKRQEEENKMFSDSGTVIFGKYKGRNIRDLDEEYLQRILQGNKKTTKQIEAELERRRSVEEAQSSYTKQIVNAGYRALALKHHPDQGGSQEDFLGIKDSKELLDALVEELEAEKQKQKEAFKGFGS